VVNGHKCAAHTDSPDGGTGKTCLGGGMHRPSASTLLWPPYGMGRPLYFCPVVSSSCIFFYLLLFFLALFSAVADWMSTILRSWCGPSANLECRSVTCCKRLAENTGRKKSPKIRRLCAPSHNFVFPVFATKACIDNWKKLLNSNISLACPHNIVNFGPLKRLRSVGEFETAASKFQRVSRLGSVTARHSSSGRQLNFAALNRGRHLYSAGRPSRWALAHILVIIIIANLAAAADHEVQTGEPMGTH